MTERSLSSVVPDPGKNQVDKASQVQDMFDRIAGTYDTLNNWISMGFHKQWKSAACRKLQLKPGNQALDVCTGTGDLIGVSLHRQR